MFCAIYPKIRCYICMYYQKKTQRVSYFYCDIGKIKRIIVKKYVSYYILSNRSVVQDHFFYYDLL